jgi:hypothetical protein
MTVKSQPAPSLPFENATETQLTLCAGMKICEVSPELWWPRDFLVWVDGGETVAFVVGGDFSVAEAYGGETFGETHARAVPPIAADSAAGHEITIFVMDEFVDVEVALQDGDDVVAFEKGEDFGRIFHRVGVVFLAAGGLGRVAEEPGDERNVNDDDDGSGDGDGLQIGGEPLQLRRIDAAFPKMVFGGENGIENYEMVALAIEGRVGAGANAIFEHFFGVEGIAGHVGAFVENAKDIVVADSVIERNLELRFGLLVEVEETFGAGTIDDERVENEVAAVDGEFGF